MQNNYEENSKYCENFYKLPESVILEAISYCYKEILNYENKAKFEERVLRQIVEKDEDLSFIF